MPKNICNDGVVQRELMDLPGFRFHPTEEELLGFYLKNRIQAARYPLNFDKIIPTIDLYQYEPWDLPGLAHDVGEKQWFFFVPRYHKKCARPNRLTLSGYWKATGSDRKIRNGLLHCIGLKKILVFYKGKVPRGQKTDWIMNEYRMLDLSSSTLEKKIDMVLCKIYQKAITQKSMEQGANHIADVDKQEVVASTDDLYEEKSHSKSRNVISCQSNPMSTEANVSSLQDEKGVCSSLCKTMDESNLFDCLEPIMPWEESMVLKTTTTCKPPHLELPNSSMDFLFSQPIETPYALLSTPSPFQIPF